VVAGLTDAMDGTLARVLKQQTMLGQYLDPVADKLLLSTLFLVLTTKADSSQGYGAGLRPRCGNPGGLSHSLRGGGPARLQPSIFGKANTVARSARLLQFCSIRFLSPIG